MSSIARYPILKGPLVDRLTSTVGPLTPIFLRLVVGYGFCAHGFAKLGRGPEHFAVILDAIGVPMPLAMAWLTTIVELVCGAAVLAGAFLPFVVLPMAVVLCTAMLCVHLQYGFLSVRLVEVTEAGARFGPVGIEVILLYLAGLSAIAFNGPGPLSVDGWRAGRAMKSSPAPESVRSRGDTDSQTLA